MTPLEGARAAIIKAALQLAAVEWDNGRLSSAASNDLDLAHDQFDGALDTYVAMRHVAVASCLGFVPRPGFGNAQTCARCGAQLAAHPVKAQK